jgi:hypothetical protein
MGPSRTRAAGGVVQSKAMQVRRVERDDAGPTATAMTCHGAESTVAAVLTAPVERHVTREELPATDRPVVSPPAGWGQLPALSVVGAGALLIVALANSAARAGADWAELAFWGGIVLLFVPFAARLVSAGASRRERLGLVALLGLGLYLVKVFHSPLAFTFHDEFLHWRTANDIATTQHLFQWNSLLPVSASYPGLEIVTTAIATVTGLSIFEAGVILLGVARLVFVVGLFLFYEKIGGSAWVAGIACLIYMANPNFVAFDAQFAYESLALAFTALIAFSLARRLGTDRTPVAFMAAAVVGLGALVMTHHLTAYAFTVFVTLWWLVTRCIGTRRATQALPGEVVLLIAVTVLAWTIYVGSLTVRYLANVVEAGVGEFWLLLNGATLARFLFSDFQGQRPPLWEQVTAYVAVGLILLVIPFGALQIWRRHRASAVVVALAAVALAYPATLALRFVPQGMEPAARTWEFLFVGIALVLALGAVTQRLSRPAGWLRSAGITAWLVAIFVGGVAVGWPPWWRLPGPYLVSADTRSIEPQGVAAAEWARTYFGPGHRVAADRINRLLMGSYGEQQTETDGVPAMFFARDLGPTEDAARRAQVEYVVVDRRLSTGLPVVGFFIEVGEPNMYRHVTPIEPALLAKFDGAPGVSRVFDSGDIRIYRVAELARAR